MISVNPRAESLNAAHVPTLNRPAHVGPPSLIVMMPMMRMRTMMTTTMTTMMTTLSEDVGIPD